MSRLQISQIPFVVTPGATPVASNIGHQVLKDFNRTAKRFPWLREGAREEIWQQPFGGKAINSILSQDGIQSKQSKLFDILGTTLSPVQLLATRLPINKSTSGTLLDFGRDDFFKSSDSEDILHQSFLRRKQEVESFFRLYKLLEEAYIHNIFEVYGDIESLLENLRVSPHLSFGEKYQILHACTLFDDEYNTILGFSEELLKRFLILSYSTQIKSSEIGYFLDFVTSSTFSEDKLEEEIRYFHECKNLANHEVFSTQENKRLFETILLSPAISYEVKAHFIRNLTTRQETFAEEYSQYFGEVESLLFIKDIILEIENEIFDPRDLRYFFARLKNPEYKSSDLKADITYFKIFADEKFKNDRMYVTKQFHQFTLKNDLDVTSRGGDGQFRFEPSKYTLDELKALFLIEKLYGDVKTFKITQKLTENRSFNHVEYKNKFKLKLFHELLKWVGLYIRVKQFSSIEQAEEDEILTRYFDPASGFGEDYNSPSLVRRNDRARQRGHAIRQAGFIKELREQIRLSTQNKDFEAFPVSSAYHAVKKGHKVDPDGFAQEDIDWRTLFEIKSFFDDPYGPEDLKIEDFPIFAVRDPETKRFARFTWQLRNYARLMLDRDNEDVELELILVTDRQSDLSDDEREAIVKAKIKHLLTEVLEEDQRNHDLLVYKLDKAIDGLMDRIAVYFYPYWDDPNANI